jgi:hypothetical protein
VALALLAGSRRWLVTKRVPVDASVLLRQGAPGCTVVFPPLSDFNSHRELLEDREFARHCRWRLYQSCSLAQPEFVLTIHSLNQEVPNDSSAEVR